MDKRPSPEKQLSAARQCLHRVLREQRAATEELQASNRELAAILNDLLGFRGELRAVDGNHPDGNHSDGHHLDGDDFPDAADMPRLAMPKDLDFAQLQREAARELQMGKLAVRESVLIRRRSEKVRAALRDGDREDLKPAKTTDHGGLSKRERQVLALIVAGKSSKRIAAELGISFKTAVTHRASIMSKMEVHEIASVVREAIRRGLA